MPRAALLLLLLSPERLRGEGSERVPTPLGKALAVALRREARADVALIPGSLLTRDADPSQPDSLAGAIPAEPCVVGDATGAAISRALEASRSRTGPYLQTAGLLLDDSEVSVGRFPVEDSRLYSVACTATLAEVLGLRRGAVSLPDLRALAARSLQAAPAPPRPLPAALGLLERRTLASGARLRVERLVFPTPSPSGVPENDRVPLTLYRPDRGNGAAVLVLPIWKGKDDLLEETIARRIAEEGFLAAVMPLAYQFERAPAGVRSGDWTLSADLPRTRSALSQSVEDARRAADLLLREGATRIAVLGVSLGGHVASAVYSTDERFGAGAFLLAGGDVAETIWRASRETAGIKAALERAGVTREALGETLRPLDPATYATPARREGAFLVGALYDRIVPPESVEALWS
ncbi:MAG: dienelactone hydrolase family protein, partial [Planctomycetota bacterium]